MATFKLFSPAIINNSPIILIKFYDEKHPYKNDSMRVPAEQQRGFKHICGVETAPRREHVPEILKDLSCCIYIQLTVNH